MGVVRKLSKLSNNIMGIHVGGRHHLSIACSVYCFATSPIASQGERDFMKYIPQCKSYSTSMAAINTDEPKNGTRLENDMNGHNRHKTVQADFLVGVARQSSGRWSMETNTAKEESPSRSRLQRCVEVRVKRHVKQQYFNGKFHDLVTKVIATPEVLQLAYESIRLNSNILLPNATEVCAVSDSNVICFSSIAKQLIEGDFDVKSNTLELLPLVDEAKSLVLPNLKLKLVQEAIRMVLEVVYKPQFSKISHSCRAGRGQHSALKYIRNQIHNPDWWFKITMQKKLDAPMFMKLLATVKENIQDDNLCNLVEQMFDANVLNLEFGGFSKGQGFPQEGILSSILMNIYLDLFDQEFYRICLEYEALDQRSDYERKLNSPNQMQPFSMLRQWLRNQIKPGSPGVYSTSCNGRKLHACRYMDEIFIAMSGSKELALALKDRIFEFLETCLDLKLDHSKTVVCNVASEGMQFLGMDVQAVSLDEVQASKKETAVKVIHKLSDKIRLFALQKQWHWEAWTKRLGEKWLAHALKKIKESDKDKPGIPKDLSELHKPGMKPDHWFKEMLKVWIQVLDKEFQMEKQQKPCLEKFSEENLLSEFIIKPQLPEDLMESYNNFQQKVKEFVASETANMNSLKKSLESSKHETADSKSSREMKIIINAPITNIKNSLVHCGLLNRRGDPQCLHALISQEDAQIIHWYTGLTQRWLNCYFCCRNFSTVKSVISELVKTSCILTLAVKHKTSNTEILKRFAGDLNVIPSEEGTEGPLSEAMSVPSRNIHLTDRRSFDNVLWLLTVNRTRDSSAGCNVACCSSKDTKVYRIYRNRKDKISVLKYGTCRTGLATLHPSLERKCICLCMKHVRDLYLGEITLQDIDFTFVPFSKVS